MRTIDMQIPRKVVMLYDLHEKLITETLNLILLLLFSNHYYSKPNNKVINK